jgi:flavin-binding protein dodecin
MVTVKFTATETANYMRRAEYAVNGGKWLPVYADDGIVDGKSETFTINAKVGAAAKFTVTLRVFDAAGNIGSARAVE